MYKYKKNKLTNKSKNIKRLEVYIFLILICIVTFTTIYKIRSNNIIDVKKENKNYSKVMSLSAIVEQDDYVIQRIVEQYKNSNIEAYYPATKHEVLNNEIKKIIEEKVSKFKNDVPDSVKYSLLINFDMYKYNNYISFVFHVLEDYAGAHPNTYIFTVNYDITNQKMINIDNLINANNNVIKLMSDFSYKTLSEDKRIQSINMPNMVKEGTKAIKSNFDKFIFSSGGLIVFFQSYQVAPYVAGEFTVTIPYEELNLKVID